MPDIRSAADVSCKAWRSGRWTVDGAARTLYRDDIELAVPPKALACLIHLIANHHRAVGRDELIDAVWGHAHLSDGVLAQTIFQLRGILAGGSADGPIRSLRGFGYRWVEPVQPHAWDGEGRSRPNPDTAQREPASPAFESNAARHNDHDRAVFSGALARWVALGVVVLAIVALFVWQMWTPDDLHVSDITSSVDARGSLLVLPVHAGAAPEATWMRLGLMDLVANRLRSAGAATVPVETALMLHREPAGSLDEARIDQLVRATGAAQVVVTRAAQASAVWVVHVDARDADGRTVRALAESSDVIAAAREAADRLALALGHAPAPLPPETAGLLSLLQQVDAALLERDLDRASQLLAGADETARAHPRLRMAEAKVAFHRLDLADARDRYQAFAASLDPITDRRLVAQARTSLASIHAMLGQPDHTRALLEALLTDLQDGGDPDLLGVVQMNLGLLAQERGDLTQADQHLTRARHLLEGVGDLQRQSVLASNLGVHALRSERPLEARAELERALAGFDTLEDRSGSLHVLAALVELHLERLDLPAADAMASRLDVSAGTSRLAQAYADTARCMLLLEHGRLTEAQTALDQLRDAMNRQPGMAPYQAVESLLRLRLLTAREAPPIERQRQADVAQERLAVHHNLRAFSAEARYAGLAAALQAGDHGAARQAAHALDAWASGLEGRAVTMSAALALAALGRADKDSEAFQQGVDAAWSALDDGASPRHWLQFADTVLPWAGDPDMGDVRLLRIAQRLEAAAGQHFGAARARARILAITGPEAAWRAAVLQVRRLAGERPLPAELDPAVASAPDGI